MMFDFFDSQNPYYQIVALMRGQAARQSSDCFLVTLHGDENAFAAYRDGEALPGPIYRPREMALTGDDDGCAALCCPVEDGYIILSRLDTL